MRRENQFNTTREEWERVVFEEATHFTVSRKVGVGAYDTKTFPDFIEAITEAVTGVQNPVPMVYAVTGSGRSVMLPKAQWTALMYEYAARHGDES